MLPLLKNLSFSNEWLFAWKRGINTLVIIKKGTMIQWAQATKPWNMQSQLHLNISNDG
jgi:hypothetical protein